MKMSVKAVLFDFGGVLADEGFREGLKAVAVKNGLDPERFFRTAEETIAGTGYLTGAGDEPSFWSELRRRTGVIGSDADLRKEILTRFVVRPEMLAYADLLRSQGLRTAILSDQTNWLEELDRARPVFGHFDAVFNSYRIGKSKRDPSLFRDACASLGVSPAEALFIDDNSGHIGRASAEGLRTIHFVDLDSFAREIAPYLRRE